MRITLFLMFCLVQALAFGQTSIEQLEKQLAEATTSKEKMTLSYQLGNEWLKKDAKKSVEYAKSAHQKALEAKNNGMAAEAAYLVSRGYARTNDDRNEDIWLGSAVKFAMAANDADLIIKTVDQRSRLAVKERNERKALQVVQEAFDYFSKKGGKGISEMQAENEVQRQQMERDRRILEREIATLSSERDILKRDKSSLSQQKAELEKEKTTAVQEREIAKQEKQAAEEAKLIVEQEVTAKEEEIKSISAEKARTLYLAEFQKRRIDSLENRKTIDSLAIQQIDLALRNSELKQEQGRYITYLLGGAAVFLVVFAGLLYMRFLSKKKSTEQLARQNRVIEEERQRSDELLYNIMPVDVAKELKEKGSATARKFSEATVLFTDFKNFTQIAERLTPEQLVNELNECFRAFDHIISQHPEIEKIKTIGDAYLCASGLVQHKTVPKGIVQAALEMQEFLEDHKREKMRLGLPFFEARIGLHTGPLVAGVVGFKKFAYDIWGDTVNIAARMESQCEPGKVNISETTWGLVKYGFECQSRGQVPVKNKGMMEMYYVNRAI